MKQEVFQETIQTSWLFPEKVKQLIKEGYWIDAASHTPGKDGFDGFYLIVAHKVQ